MPTIQEQDRVLARVEEATQEILELSRKLIRIPTVNPPGTAYTEATDLIGDALGKLGFEVERFAAEGRPEHTEEHPRINVVATRRGSRPRPCVHLNGHYDVVPAGEGWTHDPFGGEIENGRLYGRGAADMKAGLVAAIFAAEALHRAGLGTKGTIEISATADEESGGFSGVAWLAEKGRLTSSSIDHVIIPEPFGVDRICTGHRGVYWFEIESEGEIGHGSMPFLGVNAITNMTPLLEALQSRLVPALAQRRTSMPVVPEGARYATLNINSIEGGQAGMDPQTPCVADRCKVIFDRRFLVEEGFEATRREIVDILREVEAADPSRRYCLTDLMVVHPVQAPDDSPLIAALEAAIRRVVQTPPIRVASPGTYDQKHFVRIGGIDSCVAYGPGELELAHQPDESCSIADLIDSTKVMALALLSLLAPENA